MIQAEKEKSQWLPMWSWQQKVWSAGEKDFQETRNILKISGLQ